LTKAIHVEKIPQFLIGIHEHDFAARLSHMLKQAQDFADAGTVYKRNVFEVNDHFIDALIHDGIKATLKDRTIFKRNFAFDPDDSTISMRFDLDVHGPLGQNTVTFRWQEQAPDIAMLSKYVVHHHKAGRSHFDLRIVENGILRSWSLLKEPPCRNGERRLAIERESFAAESINSGIFEEEAFGRGRVSSWDEGEVEITASLPKRMVLRFKGGKMTGQYEFRRMIWYPGNRWLLTRLREPVPSKSQV
jgi:hypothetical protein